MIFKISFLFILLNFWVLGSPNDQLSFKLRMRKWFGPNKNYPLFVRKITPYCLFFDCEEDKHIESDQTPYFASPQCWFNDCEKDAKALAEASARSSWFPDCEKGDGGENESWLPDWFRSSSKKPQADHWYCKLKKYYQEDVKYLKNVLGAAKPQEGIWNWIVTNELSPTCIFTECCNEDSIPGDIEKLQWYIKKYVYGQPLIYEAVNAIQSHWNPKYMPKKALVLSFHGAAGTGKNYISNFITKSLFKLGWKSKNVHFFSGRVHFKADSKSEINKDNLLQWLGEKVKACPKQLFIFDEVHYMPESILNTIKPVLDYREIVDGADYRNAIFIFISNTGTTIINDHYKEIVKTGKRREYIELKDFEKLIFKGIFNEKGGFYHSEAIDSNLIDHYIPFLPMEEEHVIECIKDAFQEREIESPHQEYINLVLEELLWISDGPRPISKTGCKAVSAKVGIISMKYYKTGVDFPKEDL